MENILVAVSNFPAYYPIKTAFRNGDYITLMAILFVALASFISHLFENHKHGMSGLGLSPQWSYFLNRGDVLGCVIVIARFAILYYSKYGLRIVNDPFLFIVLGVAFLLLRVSEYDKYNPILKWLYIPTHCMWHMLIFTVMNYFLVTHIY